MGRFAVILGAVLGLCSAFAPCRPLTVKPRGVRTAEEKSGEPAAEPAAEPTAEPAFEVAAVDAPPADAPIDVSASMFGEAAPPKSAGALSVGLDALGAAFALFLVVLLADSFLGIKIF